MDKKISQLRTFFRVSNAAFDFTNAIQSAFNGIVTPNKMQQLHKLALEEIEKENPDLSKIDNLLAEMENLAEPNSKPKAYVNIPLLTCKCGAQVKDLNNGLCHYCWDEQYEVSK